MTQIVTKESLSVLAALAFAGIDYEDDPHAKAIYNMDDAQSCLYRVLEDILDLKMDENRAFASAFSEGMEFGLAVAAAVLNNGLDSGATLEAVKYEFVSAERYWGEYSKKEAA